MKRFILAIIFMISFWNSFYGSGMKDSLQFQVYFHTASPVIEKSYRKNKATLDSLLSHLSSIQQSMTLNKIRITSGASPEGNKKFNQWLSHARGESLREFLKENLSLPDSIFIINDKGEDWEGLTQLVSQSSLPDQEKILQMLQLYGKSSDEVKLQLKKYQGGKLWIYMQNNFFPDLRSSSVIEYEYNTPPEIEKDQIETDQEEETINLNQDSLIIQEATDTLNLPKKTEKKKKTCIALKSNLLYDAFLIPNIGIEFHFGKQWTINANWQYSWWKNDRKHLFWRIYGGDIGIRKYFGKAASKRLFTGHHVGIYGQILTYDIEWGKRGFIGGIPGGAIWDKAHYGGGVEYGYSKSISNRFNLDFSLGAGYLGGTSYEYLPQDGHYVWQATKKRHWFGPTKVEITLVWLIGNSKINRNMKGGK